MLMLHPFLLVVSEISRHEGEMIKWQPAAAEATALSESGIHLNKCEYISQVRCVHI